MCLIFGICGINSICCSANSQLKATVTPKTEVKVIEHLNSKITIETTESFIPKSELSGYAENIQPFTFAVISDPHAAEPVRKGYEKFGTARDKFKLCLDEIGQMQDDDPKFVLITGDIHLRAIKDLIADFKLPMHVVAGNHEKKEHRKELRDFFAADFKKNGKESRLL